MFWTMKTVCAHSVGKRELCVWGGGRAASPDLPRHCSNDVFENLPLPQLHKVASCLEMARFKPVDALITEGQEGKQFYVIFSGTVSVQVKGKTVATLHKGQCCGERALLLEQPASATVIANVRCAQGA